LIEKQLRELFNAFEIQGDNYNEISVMLIVCNSLNELREVWSRLNNNRKLQVLTRTEMRNAISLKDKMKPRLMNQ
jgi:hypothetical protein